MPWFTDEQVRQTPAFEGLPSGSFALVVAAAGNIYDRIAATPGILDSELRKWGEQVGISPEIFNPAVEALRQTQRAYQFGGPVPTAADGPVLGQLRAASVPLDKLTAEDLQRVAKRLKLDVPKSATKPELAEAIATA